MNLSNLDVYQSSYLKAGDLQGRSVRVTISEVTIDDIYDRRQRKTVQYGVLWFQGKKKGLVINKTRLAQLIEIFGTDNAEAYTNHQVILTPARQSGKDTISIVALPDNNGDQS